MGVLGGCSLTGWSLPTASPSAPRRNQSALNRRGTTVTWTTRRHRRHSRATPGGEGPGAIGVADGEVPDGVTVFDNRYPAVTNLDPTLLDALRQAATAAGGDGVELYVNSGWRSPAYQEQLLAQAVSKYGSRTEAARWVATPATSAHVSETPSTLGTPVPRRGCPSMAPTYGLCSIYRNEPWHYELRPVAVDDGCPALYADPTQDPRMQRMSKGRAFLADVSTRDLGPPGGHLTIDDSHGWFGTYTGIVFITVAALPFAVVTVWAIATSSLSQRCRAVVGLAHVPGRGRHRLLDGAVGRMTMLPGSRAGAVTSEVSLVPLRDLLTMPTYQIVGNLLIFAAVGFFVPVRFAGAGVATADPGVGGGRVGPDRDRAVRPATGSGVFR